VWNIWGNIYNQGKSQCSKKDIHPYCTMSKWNHPFTTNTKISTPTVPCQNEATPLQLILCVVLIIFQKEVNHNIKPNKLQGTTFPKEVLDMSLPSFRVTSSNSRYVLYFCSNSHVLPQQYRCYVTFLALTFPSTSTESFISQLDCLSLFLPCC
jgi:hypothetical protein